MTEQFHSQVIVISLIRSPFSSRKRRQKSHIPGPLITAPRIIFFPLLSVKRVDVQLSTTMSLSPESIRTSLPFNHHMDAELHPAAILTFLVSSGQLMMVTSQKSTPFCGLFT